MNIGVPMHNGISLVHVAEKQVHTDHIDLWRGAHFGRPGLLPCQSQSEPSAYATGSHWTPGQLKAASIQGDGDILCAEQMTGKAHVPELLLEWFYGLPTLFSE
jgi:hypothetical protein